MAKKYELTGKVPKVSGQARLVYDGFKALKVTDLHELATWLENNGLKTVQTPERIAAYYISVFKSSGVATEVNVEELSATVSAQQSAIAGVACSE